MSGVLYFTIDSFLLLFSSLGFNGALQKPVQAALAFFVL